MGSAISFLFSLLAVILFSFILWRRLKEDYAHEKIFYLTLLTLLGALAGWFLTDKTITEFSFWGFVAGTVIFTSYAIKKLGLKLFEVVDAASLGIFWLLLFTSIAVAVRRGIILEQGVSFLPQAFALLALYSFVKKYRNFSWYPSGKIGFVGFASLAVFFSVRFIIAFYFFFLVQSVSNAVNLALSLVVSIICFVIVYLRSGRSGAEKLLSIFARKV